MGPIQPPIQWVFRVFILEVQQPVREADHHVVQRIRIPL